MRGQAMWRPVSGGRVNVEKEMRKNRAALRNKARVVSESRKKHVERVPGNPGKTRVYKRTRERDERSWKVSSRR